MFKLVATLSVSLISSAISINQQIELTDYMNARYSASFRKDAKNKVGILAKGTSGTVQEVKSFPSGNFGILALIADGKFKNQNVWIYYNKNAPTLTLKDQNKQETTIPHSAETLRTTKPTPAVEEPKLPKALDQIAKANDAIDRLEPAMTSSPTGCASCNTDYPGKPGGLPQTGLPISTSKSAEGLLSARIQCSYKGEMGQSHPGRIQLEIVNNQVQMIDATIQGCKVTAKDFKQIKMANNNIALEDKNGCTVAIYESLKVKASGSSPVLNFGMAPTADCAKTCPQIEKKFWQVEMNPNTNSCY